MKKNEKVWRALDFLNNHPAFGMGFGDGFMSWAAIWIQAYDAKGRTVDVPTAKSEVHNTQWGADISFAIFEGNPNSRRQSYDQKKWGRFQGFIVKGGSFEDLVLESAKQVSKIFGSFDNYRSFLTEEEIINHEQEAPFFFEADKDSKRKGRIMVDNPEYTRVESGKINQRWFSWFVDTEWCRKSWGDKYFDDIKKRLKGGKFQGRLVDTEFLV